MGEDGLLEFSDKILREGIGKRENSEFRQRHQMAGGRASGRDSALQSAAGVLNRESPTSLPASQSTPRIHRADSFGGIFRLKPSDSQLTFSELHKTLTVRHLVAMGVGSTLGAGVYVLIGTAARERAGPALTVSFLIAGIAAGMAALCYVELASRCPSAGSAYAYAYTCVGEVVAWLIGWAMILEYTVGGAAVARGISPNLAVLFGGEGHVPFWLARVNIPGTNITADPVAGVLVVLITLLLCMGIKESVGVQTAMMLGNVAVLLFVVVAGSYCGYTTGWQGYKQPDGFLPFGVNGMLGGAAMVFFAYIGFDTVASAAEEVEHPQRDLPLGIGLSLLACGSLYMAIAAVLVGMVSYKELDPDTPMSKAFSKMGMPWAMYVTAAGALAALATTLLGSLIPQPRILMAMARDGLLPKWFAEVNGAGVPKNATVATGLVAAAMAFAMDIDQLSGMVSVGTLLAFTSVSAAILIVRYVPPSSLPHPSTNSLQPATDPPRRHPTDAAPTAATPGLPPRPPPRTTGLPPLPRPPSAVQVTRPTFSVGDTEVDSPPYLASSPGEGEDYPLVMGEPKPGNGGGLRNGNSEIRARGTAPPRSDGTWVTSPPGSALSQNSLGSPFIRGAAGRPEAVHERKARRKWAGTAIGGVCVGVSILAVTAAAEDTVPVWCRWAGMAMGTPVLLGASGALLMMPEDDGKHTFGQPHGFQCPGVPLIPILSIVVNVYLMVNLGLPTWMRTGVWLVLGALIYFLYGRQNSVLHPKVPIVSPRVSARSHSWHGVKVDALDDFDGLEVRQPLLKVSGSFQ